MRQLLLGTYFIFNSLSIFAEYNPSVVYGALMYNILASYTREHPGCNADAVRAYLNSKETNIVFSDALAQGYGRRRVIKSCYHLSMQAEPPIESVINALRDDIRLYLTWKDIFFWATIGCSSFSAIVSLYGCGFFINYYRRDHRVINHYRHQSLGGFFPASDND